MKFNTKKFRISRKNSGYSIEELANLMNISRVTLWAWEKGKRVPSEKKIRMLAQCLNINLSDFSDLPDSVEISKSQLGEIFQNSDAFIDSDIKKRIKLKDDIIYKINYMDKELNTALILIKTIINSMNSMFYIKDANLDFIMTNKSFSTFFSKYRDSDFICGRTDKDFFDNKFAKQNREQDEQVLLTGIPVIKKEGYLPGSRKNRWVLTSKLPVMDNTNRIAGVIGIFNDITQRKKEEDIRIILEANVDNMSDGLTIFNIDTRKFIFVNKAAELIFGITAKQFFQGGLPYLKKHCIHPDYPNFFDDIDSYYHNQRKKIKYKIIKPDGEIRWLEIRRSTADSKYMDGLNIISITRDITDRKTLEEKNQFLLDIIDDFHDVVWISELDENNFPVFRYLNDEIENLTGYKKEDFLTNKIVFRDIVLPEDREELDFWLTNKVSPGVFESRIKCADNSMKWINSKISKTVDNKGKPIFYGLLRDITYKKVIEKNRESLDLLLNNALDVISAYDINTKQYLYINKIVEKITGHPVEEFYKKGASFWLNTCIHPDDREQRIIYHKKKSWPEKSRYRIIKPNGEIRWLEVTISNNKFPFFGKQCIVSVARDITNTTD